MWKRASHHGALRRMTRRKPINVLATARHDEGQFGVPRTSHVQEREHRLRIGHAGQNESRPEEQAGHQRDADARHAGA